MTKTIIVLNPTAKASRPQLTMAPRPEELNGKVVAFLWNDKWNGNVILSRIEEELGERFELAGVVQRKKPSAAFGVTEELLKELSAGCDVVINALGD